MGNSCTIFGKTRTPAALGKQLHRAVRAGKHDLASKLLADGAPVDAKDFQENTPLNVAVLKRDAEMMRLLAAGGADKDALNWSTRLYTSPLVIAARMDDHAFAEALLVAGADASLRPQRFTALDVAAINGNVGVLAVLIKHGVDLNDEGDFATTLQHAARTNKADVVDVLVAGGADMEATGKHFSGNPLHGASMTLSLEAAVVLLKHGADVNARDKYGATPLHAAAGKAGKRGAVEMVDLLLRWGAEETATRPIERTPADVAGLLCRDLEEEGGVERVRELLANAPVAREAWRRRGLLVASRGRPQMVLLSASTQACGEWTELMGRVLGLAEEGVFRTIVGYL